MDRKLFLELIGKWGQILSLDTTDRIDYIRLDKICEVTAHLHISM